MRESDTDAADGRVQAGTPERAHDARGQAAHATDARVFRPSTVGRLFMMLAICSACTAGGAPRQVIIDTDPGTDDAIAIMLALNSPELAVRALTVVAGNVPAAQGLDNALRLVSLARRCDLPVAIGAQRPLVGILTTAELYHGKNGLGDVQLPPATCAPDKRWAPDLIVDLVHAAPQEITLITIGPLTNIALALAKDPSIVPLVKEVIMMGGSVSGGNASPAAEFNVYVDPEAAKIVFEAGWPLIMVGLDVGDKALLTRSHLAVLAHEHSPMAQLVSGIGAFMLQRADRAGRTGASMYDPLAIGVAIDRTLVQVAPMRVDVETTGRVTRGETVTNRSGKVSRHELRTFPEGDRYVATGAERVAPNADVATMVDAERFVQLLLSRIEGK
jgi:inosine-uridine nucleoside N-ribohydrolase